MRVLSLFITSVLAQASLRILSTNFLVSKTATLDFEIIHNSTKLRLSDLDLNHEMRIHALLIPKDLNSIAHVHPFDQSSTVGDANSTTLTIPAHFEHPGDYTMFISYSIQSVGFTQQQVIRVVSSTSYTPKVVLKTLSLESNFQPQPFQPHSQLFDEFISITNNNVPTFTARMTTPTSSGTCYTFELLESVDGIFAPIKNLTTYLGMSGHFSLINEDSSVISHLHGNNVACMEEPVAEPSSIKKRLKRSGMHMHELATNIFGPFLYVTIDKSFTGFHRLVVQTARGDSLINLFYGLEL